MNITLKNALLGLVVVAGMFGTAATAHANTGGGVRTPVAMTFFCQQNPGECRGGGGSQVAMSDDVLQVLQTVTRRVNNAISYRSERVDKWSLNPSSGDCEDYALSKRSALIRAGIPAGALRIAFTYTRRGLPHAVLLVKSNSGDYVLDNLNSKVARLADTGYNIVMVSGSNPMRWTRG